MLTFYTFFLESQKPIFPEQKTGIVFTSDPVINIKEPYPNVFVAYHKNKRVGIVSIWKDLKHKKLSSYKSEVHPDYRRMGILTKLYKYIENKLGEKIYPSSTLSDDGHAFWLNYRPEEVKDDLRSSFKHLIGKKYTDSKYGEGIITSIGSGVAIATKPNGNTFPISKNDLIDFNSKINTPV